MAYSEKYRFRFDSFNGTEFIISILQDGYDGTVISRHLGGSPKLKRENNDNIWGSSLEFPAECLIDGEFSELYATSATEFKVNVTAAGVLIWTGYLTPELYSEPDIAAPYDVTITATDNLGELKNSHYSAIGIHNASISTILYNLLALTGFALDIEYVGALASEDYSGLALLTNTFLDIDNLDDGDTSAYDVLQSLLSTLHAVVMQGQGHWMIIRETDIASNANKDSFACENLSDMTFRQYPMTTFGRQGVATIWPSGNLTNTISPAKKSLKVSAENNYKSIILNTAMSSDIEWTKSGGATFDTDHYVLPAGAIISQQKTLYGNWPSLFTFSVTARTLPPIVTTVESQNLSVMVKITGGNGVNNYFYKNDDSTEYNVISLPENRMRYGLARSYPISRFKGIGITTTPTFIPFKLNSPENGNSEDNQTLEFQISIPLALRPAIANPTSVEIRIYNNATDYSVAVHACTFIFGSQLKGNSCNLTINNSAREKLEDVTILIPYLASKSKNAQALIYAVPHLSDLTAVIQFKTSRFADYADYLTNIAKDYAISCALPRLQKEGTLNIPKNFQYLPILLHSEQIDYLVKTFEWDLLNDDMQVSMISLPGSMALDVDSTVYDDTDAEVVEDPKTLILSSSSSSVTAAEGTKSVDVTTDDSWSVASNSAWAVPTKNSSTNFTIAYAANGTTSTRAAIITVTGSTGLTATYTLTQEAGEETGISLTVDPISFTGNTSFDTFSVTVILSGAETWTIDSYPNWAVPSVFEGEVGETVITITLSDSGGDERSGNIVFKSGSVIANLFIMQSNA
jgi:hypothetical protein